MLPVVPDDEPFKAELKQWRENVFLELPEDNRHQWVAVAEMLQRHFPEDKHADLFAWQRDVEQIWFDKDNAEIGKVK